MQRIVGLMVLCLVGLEHPAGRDTKRPEMSGVAFVRIGAGDLQTTTSFYHGTLRLPNLKCSDQSAKCFFVNPSQEVELIGQTAPPSRDRVDAIGIFTTDADSLRQYLLANGQKSGELVSNAPWGISPQIKDPEGPVLDFVQDWRRCRVNWRALATRPANYSLRSCGEGYGSDGHVLSGYSGLSLLAWRDERWRDGLGDR
jgi:hypothetical protein